MRHVQTKDNYRNQLENSLKKVASPTTELVIRALDRGPTSIESVCAEYKAGPHIFSRVLEAAKEGFDAVVISCVGDPALHACRELVEIPIVGAGMASMTLAASLGHYFSVITVLDEIVPLIAQNVRILGLASKLASVRAVSIPVLELESDIEKTKRTILEEARKAIKEDGADVIALGCTGMIGMAEDLTRELGIPVIDPILAALKMAEALVEMGLSHSKTEYPKPPEKMRLLDNF